VIQRDKRRQPFAWLKKQVNQDRQKIDLLGKSPRRNPLISLDLEKEMEGF
jgi:hypothetical protein